jgi:hypothetical protein
MKQLDSSSQGMSAYDAKIIRACVSSLQSTHKSLRIEDYEVRAAKELEPFFKEKGVPCEYTISEKGVPEFKEKNDARDIMIAETARNILRKDTPLSFSFEVDEMAKMLDIKTEDVKYLRRRLKKMQIKSAYSVAELYVNRQTMEIEEEIHDIILVPTITTRRGMIVFEINPKAAPYLIALSKNYTEGEMSTIAMLKKHDGIVLLEQLLKIRKIQDRVRFSLLELYAIFGKQNYKQYAAFKRDILKKAIQDIEENTSYRVEIIEVKDGKKVVSVGFSFYDSAPKESGSSKENLISYIVAMKYFKKQSMTHSEMEEERAKVRRLLGSGNFVGQEAIEINFNASTACLHEAETLIREHELTSDYAVDWNLFSIKKGNSFLADNAPAALQILKTICQNKKEHESKNQSYIDFDNFDNGSDELEEFHEFNDNIGMELNIYINKKFRSINAALPAAYMSIDSLIGSTCEKHGKEAIKEVADWLIGEGISFFQDLDTPEKFIQNFERLLRIKKEGVEIVSEYGSTAVVLKERAPHPFLLYMRRRNPQFGIGHEVEWEETLSSIEESFGTKEDFYKAIALVLDYMHIDKDGKKFYLTHVAKGPEWFAERWSQIMQRAAVWNMDNFHMRDGYDHNEYIGTGRIRSWFDRYFEAAKKEEAKKNDIAF